jgi:hypothetical protein
LFGLPLGSRPRLTVANLQREVPAEKRQNAIFIFNREQALAKLTWWLADSNVTGR